MNIEKFKNLFRTRIVIQIWKLNKDSKIPIKTLEMHDGIFSFTISESWLLFSCESNFETSSCITDQIYAITEGWTK